jgi:hypothetical protein
MCKLFYIDKVRRLDCYLDGCGRWMYEGDWRNERARWVCEVSVGGKKDGEERISGDERGLMYS